MTLTRRTAISCLHPSIMPFEALAQSIVTAKNLQRNSAHMF